MTVSIFRPSLPTRLTRAVRALFAAGEQGAWFDPSDLTSMFQDSAGTTPVTAVSQPVGKILDKSGRGNHSTQATAAARPTLSARVNIIRNDTSNMSAATWSKGGSPTFVTGVTDPDGGTNAVRMTATAAGNEVYQGTAGQSGDHIGNIYVRRETGTGIVKVYNPGGSTYTDITATLTTTWQRFSTAVQSGTSGTTPFIGVNLQTLGDAVDIAFPQVQSGSTVTAYQRSTSIADYDTVGFPLKADYDGIDDLLTASNPDLGTNVTIARATATGASILTGQTVGANYVDSTDNYGLILINRALTAAETASVTAYLNMKVGL